MSTRNEIKFLLRRREATLNELLQIKEMIRGSYFVTHRKCGKSNCWCADDQSGHPYHRITWTRHARPGAVAVPREDVQWIKNMTASYKKFRSLRTALRRQDKELGLLLDRLEEELADRSGNLRDYL